MRRLVVPIVVLLLVPITARAEWAGIPFSDAASADATKTCHELGGVVVEGLAQSYVTPEGISCEAGVLDPKCGDYCGEFPRAAFDDPAWDWDPQDSDEAERIAGEARLWEERLERFGAAKVEDAALHRKRVIAYSRQLAEVSDALLERWGKLERRKAGPSGKSLRAMKTAWKDARRSALALLDEFEDD